MTQRDPTWQAAVIQLDGYRSQILGFDGRDENERGNLVGHHHKRRGMGGISSRDELANGITVTNEEHRWLHDSPPKLVITEWDREAGILVVEDRVGVILDEPGIIPREQLWFYRGRLKAELEEEEGLLTTLEGSDCAVARIYWRRWVNDNFKLLDAGAASFRAYTEARDWPTNRAERLAELYDLSRQCGIPWPANETSRGYRKRLRNAGVLVEDRDYWHFAIRDRETLARLIRDAEVELVRCSDDAFADSGKLGFKIGKCYKLRAVKGKILGLDDKELSYAVLEKEEVTT